MVICVPGEFYTLDAEKMLSNEELDAIVADLGENDIVEIRIAGTLSGTVSEVYHISKAVLKYDLTPTNLTMKKNADVFQKIAEEYVDGIPIPIVDQEGNCVNIVMNVKTVYNHTYSTYEGGLNMDLLDQHDIIALEGVNSYSVELYKEAVPLWNGRELILVGTEWQDYMDVLPTPNGQVTIAKDWNEYASLVLHRMLEYPECNPICIREKIAPDAEAGDRHKKGIFYYDEIMAITFLFSSVIHPGSRNPDKKFFLIDGQFYVSDLYVFVARLFLAARYAVKKGYVPAIMVTLSDHHMYSDYAGDDIYGKFFCQPSPFTLQDISESCYVAVSQDAFLFRDLLANTICNMVEGTDLQWPSGFYNNRINAYIKERMERFLPCPERTLGVLIRGTDYIHNPYPNHPRPADVEQVIAKIEEVRDDWGFDRIFLSTEDIDICERMKEKYGDILTFTDQERFRITPGQVLADFHRQRGKSPGRGFDLGAQYICTISLLAKCRHFIASCYCGGVYEAIRQNENNYENIYVFEVSAPQ